MTRCLVAHRPMKQDGHSIRRGQLGIALLLVMALTGALWYMLHHTANLFSRAARSSRQAVQRATSTADLTARLQANSLERAADIEASVREMVRQIRNIGIEGNLPAEVAQWMAELDSGKREPDVHSLTELRQRASKLLDQLNDSYEVHVVGTAHLSGVTDENELDDDVERDSYYLIVEARGIDGKVLNRAFPQRESEHVMKVSRWAESVPEKFFLQLKASLQNPGADRKRLFSIKQRGQLDEKILIMDGTEQPFARRSVLLTR